MEVAPLGQVFVRITRAKLQSAEVIFPKEKSKIICLSKHWEYRLFFFVVTLCLIQPTSGFWHHWAWDRHLSPLACIPSSSSISQLFQEFPNVWLHMFAIWDMADNSTSIWSRCEVSVFYNVDNCQLFVCSLRLPRFVELERILHCFSPIKMGWEITLHFHFYKVKFLLLN